MDKLLNIYVEKLSTFSENSNPELEIKFGTKGNKAINKSNFNNVIRSLLNFGFKNASSEEYLLRTSLEIDDQKIEMYKNLRFEINGLKNIQNYCITNQVPDILDDNFKFMNKQLYTYAGVTYYPIEFPDYNFRVTYNIENIYSSTSEPIKKVIDNWKGYKKMFRYLKRYKFTNTDYPFAIDISIVKSTLKKYGKMQTTYTLRESDLFNNPENYEIEIELLNSEIGIGNKYSDPKLLVKMLKK